jgi:hypothetical protein
MFVNGQEAIDQTKGDSSPDWSRGLSRLSAVRHNRGWSQAAEIAAFFVPAVSATIA